MLTITQLTASLGSLAILNGVEMTVRPGELHALLGPNGSGKSTLGRVLLGDPRYSVRGEITLAGQSLTERAPHERAQAGYFLSFQSPPEIEGVGLTQVLSASRRSLTGAEVISQYQLKKELRPLLSRLSLSEDFLTRPLHHGASGGEKRKTEAAMLLMQSPQVAFLDEIDSGIDVDGIQALARELQAYRARRPESAMIIVSHGQRLLELLPVTHAHVLVGGRIVQQGGAELIQRVHEQGFSGLTPAPNPRN